MCSSIEHKTKKVYRAKHAAAKAKAYKRDKSNKLNPLDYVEYNYISEFQEESRSVQAVYY